MHLMETLYTPPVDKLLTLGETPRQGTGIDYSTHGITQEHVPDLIRMAADEKLNSSPGDSTVVWAPIHAWWALAQLRAEQAILPLLGLFSRIETHQDDWVESELPRVFAAIGPATIGPLAAYLADSSKGEWSRVNAACALAKVGQKNTESRDECVTRLTNQLERFSQQTESINALIVTSLVELRAVESTAVIEKAFAFNAVDESVMGDWEDVQVALGLKVQRKFRRKPSILDQLRADFEALAEAETNLAELEPIEDRLQLPPATTPYIAPLKVGRNDPCPCGSGKKYKKCCLK